MELVHADEALKFAEDVRSYVRAELPDDMRRKVLRGERVSRDEQVFWQRKLCDRGFATPNWPAEHGGPGWTLLERYLYDNVTADEGAPASIPFGEGMIAPVLMAVGTPEQKSHYLPRIRTLEYFFCQGFSEPQSGSDLASLRTRAVLDGDEWVINGQKMWTSLAHDANMIFCLVRTDSEAKAQHGLSLLIFPIDLPGVTIRPIVTIDENHDTNEVFLDDVHVPRSSLVGEAGRGWSYAKLLLSHERTEIARIGHSKREVRQLKDLARGQRTGDADLLSSPSFREKVARVEIDLLALEMTALRSISADERGAAPGVEANILKIRGSEIQQRLTELKLEAVGPYGLPFDPARGLRLGGEPPIGPDVAASLGPNYLITRVVTIYAGSNEIQRNIIAKVEGL